MPRLPDRSLHVRSSRLGCAAGFGGLCRHGSLELCLSAHRLSRLGRGQGVDKSRFPIQQLDLTLADDLTLLLDIIRLEAGNLAWIHCAPPCGTASAARARPLKGVQTANFRAPVPLRSPREPQGLSTLSGLDRTRVEQANLPL